MTLFRNNGDGKLYTIEHLILDTRFLNHNGFSGIYAYPFRHTGPVIEHTKERQICGGLPFNPEKFVAEEFSKVAELSYA